MRQEDADPEPDGVRRDEPVGNIDRRQQQHDPEQKHGPAHAGFFQEPVTADAAEEIAEQTGNDPDPAGNLGYFGAFETALLHIPELIKGCRAENEMKRHASADGHQQRG